MRIGNLVGITENSRYLAEIWVTDKDLFIYVIDRVKQSVSTYFCNNRFEVEQILRDLFGSDCLSPFHPKSDEMGVYMM